MASISWLCSLHMRPTACNFTASAGDKGLSSPITVEVEHRKRRPRLLSSLEERYTTVNRRQLILYTGTATIAVPATVPNALALNDVSEDVRIYTDDENKFKIEVPQGELNCKFGIGSKITPSNFVAYIYIHIIYILLLYLWLYVSEWQVGTGESNGFKSLTAFYSQEESNSNVSVVITGLGPDYTKMESFGKVEEFADTLVSGLDRSWKKPPGVAAKLISCKSSKGFYYIEYTLQNSGESRKHLYSAIGMSLNGWYNRLYTVTGQFVDEETDKYASKIQKAVGVGVVLLDLLVEIIKSLLRRNQYYQLLLIINSLRQQVEAVLDHNSHRAVQTLHM